MRYLRKLAMATLLSGVVACSTVNPYYDASKPHHRPNGFVNSDPILQIGTLPWYHILMRRMRGDFEPGQPPTGGYEQFIADWSLPLDPTSLAKPTEAPRLTWLGHAGMLLQLAGKNILIDPQLSAYAGPFALLSSKRRVPAPIRPDQLPPIDLVLISHNHYDHLDKATVLGMLAAGQKPQFLVPLGVKAWFDDLDVDNVVEMDWWDNRKIDTLRIHFTPAQHWSKRTPFDTNASLWGGFAIELEGATTWRFLYTGDTGYSKGFREIRQRLGPVDFLAIPVGAYLPRDFMAPQHINPDDAVKIMLDLDARQAMGVHWGTFELTQESFDQPPLDVAIALRQHNLPVDRLWMLKHGETRQLPSAHQ